MFKNKQKKQLHFQKEKEREKKTQSNIFYYVVHSTTRDGETTKEIE